MGFQGISLSGGQKQRLSICRALYSGADILIFDDPLSALDAHVGKAVFNNVLLKKDLSHNTTRVLVTHGLHFLPQVDYIYTMVDGRIAERGTYKELIEKGGAFAKFVSEFGGDEQNEGEGSGEGQGDQKREEDGIVDKKARVGAALMQAEERNTGAVSGSGKLERFSLSRRLT
jgi:ABC-type multidrug transport system ATPase subunit